MGKKIIAVVFAVLTCFVFSVGAFAAGPTDEASTPSTGNEFLDSYFADWQEAGEQAIALRDTFKQFLYNVCTNAGLEKILGDAKDIPIAWLRTTKAGVFALTPLDNIYYWLVGDNLVFDDRTSGESIKKTVDQTVKDPTIYVPTPWMDVVQPSSGGGSSGGGGGNSDISGVFSTVGSIIPNFFDSVLKPVISFCTTNPLTLIFLGIGFIGIGIRYMRRVTHAFGRGR